MQIKLREEEEKKATNGGERSEEMTRRQMQIQEDVSYNVHSTVVINGVYNSLFLSSKRINEEIMREREEEIRNIHKGMHQVNEIYKVRQDRCHQPRY